MKCSASLIIVVAALGLASGSAGADMPTLTAIVGTNDGFNITLNDSTGKKVSRLLPGTYTVVVDDRSTIHIFHLASNDDATVDFRTDLAFVGQQSFTVTFRNNTRYAYACEPHWMTMNGSFFVTDAPEPPPPPPPAPPPPVRTLEASVSAGGGVGLRGGAGGCGRHRRVRGGRTRGRDFHPFREGGEARHALEFSRAAPP